MRVPFLVLASFLLICFTAGGVSPQEASPRAMPDGEFIYNVPCKVVNINQSLPGKSVLFLWLHGGVKVRKAHDLFQENHLDYCEADDMIIKYLQSHGIKAIALLPVCYRAVNPECITWKECYEDVRHIIFDYINKGLVDANRVYVAGSSDGGTGTWDYAELHPEMFAAGIAMSCGRPRMTAIPVFFFNTADETDCTQEVKTLLEQGSNIQVYKHCLTQKHGGDAAECTDELLDKFFGFTK